MAKQPKCPECNGVGCYRERPNSKLKTCKSCNGLGVMRFYSKAHKEEYLTSNNSKDYDNKF